MKKSYLGFDSDLSDGKLNLKVFIGSLFGVFVFILYAAIFTEEADVFFNELLGWVNSTFGWYYMVAAFSYLAFVIFISFSKFGDIRLGADDSRPEFSLISWAAMLFAAGIGIDILFFCVAEPLAHFLQPPEMDPESIEAMRQSIPLTFFHWGFTGWGMYPLMGMALAYFSYRHKLPLAIRSILYPFIGEKINGPIGYGVDITAVIGTIFGLATSLGIGVIQLNYGLNTMFGISESLNNQIILIAAVVLIATLSAISGVEKGIRRLSELNMLLACFLLAFVLLQGSTLSLLDKLVINVGDYFNSFVSMSFNTYAFSSENAKDWKGWWTIFFWAWWIAWTPFVGMFLARISRGRTIREFSIGALLIPVGFIMAWMSIFGNSAIDQLVVNHIDILSDQAINSPQSTIYTLLEQYPFVSITTTAVIILSVLFFVTSADSGALVLANFTSILFNVDDDAPIYLRAFWASIIGIVTVILLVFGGLNALQSMVVVAALPFSIVLFISMFSLFTSLKHELDSEKIDSSFKTISTDDWRHRLSESITLSHNFSSELTFNKSIRPALDSLLSELKENGYEVQLNVYDSTYDELENLIIKLKLDNVDDFIYEIRPSKVKLYQDGKSPKDSYFIALKTYLNRGVEGRVLNGFTYDQVINDFIESLNNFVSINYVSKK